VLPKHSIAVRALVLHVLAHAESATSEKNAADWIARICRFGGNVGMTNVANHSHWRALEFVGKTNRVANWLLCGWLVLGHDASNTLRN